MEQKLYPLSNPQNAIWLTEQYHSGTCLNNIGGYVLINEKVDINALEEAINYYFKANEAARIHIIQNENGVPMQYITNDSFRTIPKTTITDVEEFEKWNETLNQTPFSILDNDLVRFHIFILPNGHGGFNITVHHLVTDAWGMSLLVSEVMENYAKLIAKEEVSYTTPNYTDFIASEKEYLASDKCKKDEEFWSSIFDEAPEVCTITQKKANISDTTAKREAFVLEPEIYEKISEFCTKQHGSIYTFWLAIYSLYLAKINNTKTSILGTPILNRTNFKEKHTSGMFISAVPLKVSMAEDATFESFFHDVSTLQMSIFRHQKYPYSKLLEDLKKKYNFTENLYDIALSYQNARTTKETCSISYDSTWLFPCQNNDTLQIHFYDFDNSGTMNIYYDYQTAKLSSDEIHTMHDRILALISQVLENSSTLLDNLEIVTLAEKKQILTEFNQTSTTYNKTKSIVSIIEEYAQNTPSATALVFEDKTFTYEELNRKANQLAHFIQKQGIAPNSKIAIFMPRCSELVLAMLAIKKAGCAYLLIEQSLPTERITYMLENAEVSLVITSKGLDTLDFSSMTTQKDIATAVIEDIVFEEFSDANLNVPYSEEDPLSVVYTSGSTGTPKGILVKNASILNLVLGYCTSMQAHTFQNFLSICSVSFDMFAAEVWIPLLLGKKLVLANEEESKNPILMSSLIEKEAIEFMLITSSKMNLLLYKPHTRECLQHLKAVQFGGEVLTANFFSEFTKYSRAKVYNGYGPSETTSCATCKLVTSGDDITIGKPLPNVQVYICNSSLNLCPIGVVGELCIAGDGVSYGYVNSPDLTEKSFANNPFGDGLLYKTGDLARFLPNGEIEFMGRNDSQVKIRGLRVELEEIDKVVQSFADVSKSICVVKKINHIDSICCYVVATHNSKADANKPSNLDVSSSKLEVETLKNYVSKKLPYYMVPSHFILLEDFPLTLNGKIDTKRLPEISGLENEYVAPENDLQEKLITIWKSLLQLDKIGIEDNFFDIGGDSLACIKLVSEIYAQFGSKVSVKDVFENATIRKLSNYLEAHADIKTSAITIAKATAQKSYPLSSAQKRIYYASSMEKDSILYNIAGGIILDKDLDVAKLEECFSVLLKRHDVLRTRFLLENEEIVQVISDDCDFTLEVETLDRADLASSKQANLEDDKATDLEAIYTSFVKPFDLSVSPLLKAKLVKMPNHQNLLLLNMHHIISDGTSFAILTKELCDLYNGNSLPEKMLDYKDFTLWEKEQVKTESFKQLEEFWVNQYQDEIPLLNMPTTFVRPSVQSFEGANYHAKLPKEVFEKVNAVAKKLEITPYMLMLASYYILLSKYTSQEDIVVGTPFANRELPELSSMLGMFVNTLALKTKVVASTSFRDFSQNIKEYCLNAFQNGSYPFDKLLKALGVKRDTSRNPLFDVMFIYQNDGYPEICFEDAKATYFTPDNAISKFDLSLEVMPIENEFTLRFEYCTKLFDEDFIARFASHYCHILNAILENVDVKIADIDMLSEEERNQILVDFNDTAMDVPQDKTIVELFEEQVNKTPDAIAVSLGEKTLTYKELNEKANSLATILLQSGVATGDAVGVYLPRSLELILSIFGILKAGGVYMPMYTGYPADRLEYMLENSNAKALITSSKLEKNLTTTISKIVVDSDTMPCKADAISLEHISTAVNSSCDDTTNNLSSTSITPDSLAYVIYTSGSTGRPKGVKITHQNLINFVYAFTHYYQGITSEDSFFASTNISFDVSIWEIFMPLLNGAKLVLNTEEIISDIALYCKNIVENKITALYIPPNILNEVFGILAKSKSCLINKLLVGVEAIRKSTLNHYFELNPNLIIVNGYGPTETTICATAFPYNKDTSDDSFVSIGRPLCNNQVYILNSDQHLCPIGVPGELCVAGSGVGKGYLNNQEETNKLFVPNPFAPKDGITPIDNSNNMSSIDSQKSLLHSQVLYKTGDLAKWNADGTISFIGRIDNQIKLSGYRIELNEINSCINQYPGVKSSFTMVQTHNQKDVIVSYFIADAQIENKKLLSYLSSKLPFYMLPKFFMQVDAFPLTPNGKIDSQKFPTPNLDSKKVYVEPTTMVEKKLATILETFIGTEKLSITDNLFDFGMDSLMSIKLSVKLLEEFEVSLNVNDIFAHPTIQDLATLIASLSKTQKDEIKPVAKADYYPISSAQKRIYYASSMDKDSILYNIAGGIVLDKPLDMTLLQDCFKTLIARHEVLRTRFALVEDEIVQIVEDAIDFTLPLETTQTDDLDTIYAHFVKPFDLSRAPLFRAKAVSLNDGKMLLLLDMHHIISDGASLSILMQELCSLYNGFALPEKQIDYKDFAIWEKEQFESEKFKQIKEFWVNQYQDEIPLLNMPTTFARPSTQSFVGSNYHVKLSSEIFEKVHSISKELGITPYMLLLASYYILLSKYSSQEDIVIGTPFAGRELPELSNMLGMFVNTLTLRNKVMASSSFKDFALTLKSNCLAAFQNGAYPFDELVKALNVKRDTSRNPLFDVMFIYQNDGYPEITFKNVKSDYLISDIAISKFDLSLEVVPIDNEFRLRFEYCSKLFDEDFISKLASHYCNILKVILENVDTKIADITMLSKEEENQLLYDFNATTVDYPTHLTLLDLFHKVIQSHASNVALSNTLQEMTYDELDKKSNFLANELQSKGIAHGDVVGVCLNRNIELLVSIWAILKLGAVYMPMYIGYPKDRLNYMLSNSNAKIVITNSNLSALFDEHPKMILDTFATMSNLDAFAVTTPISPDDTAYIIYTSGSTGRPKGVKISHKNLINFVYNFNTFFNRIGPSDVFLTSTNISFDVSIWELFMPILNGAKLVFHTEEILTNLIDYASIILSENITALYIPPNILNEVFELLKNSDDIKINKLLVGVEGIKKETLNKYFELNKDMTIVNGYGPTETTICATALVYQKDTEDVNSFVSIGRPLYNNQIYILSQALKPQAIGIPGEIYIGGLGVGNGYIGNPDANKKSFVKINDHLFYKSGDLAKWNKDGTIHFIGRIDNQVKLNGYRIELNEITSVMQSYPNINQCYTMMMKNNNHSYLVSYYTADSQVSVKDLKAYLQTKLTFYMIPKFLIQIEAFPMTVNGKIDYKALPVPDYQSDIPFVAPRSNIEKKIAKILCNLLSLKEISIDENFFDIGCDSLTAIKIQLEALKEDINISYGDIFQYPTVRQLAELKDSTQNTSYFTIDTNYDYTSIEHTLMKNKTTNCFNVLPIEKNTCLLLGSTGFLGAHILDSYFTNNPNNTIYCIVRRKSFIDPSERLKKTLNYYFGTKYDEYFTQNKIIVIEGDICEKYFGLSIEQLNILMDNIDVIINSAALVKHYGNYETFSNINIEGTKSIIHVCKEYHKKLYHISTLSVAGLELAEWNTKDTKFIFDETCFYIRQQINNVYLYTKFEAEKNILAEIEHGLDATILRIGNLTNRYFDGVFQMNVSENAFVNKIKAIIQLQVIQDFFMKHAVELTPVDACADAIIKIMNVKHNFSVLHLFNTNFVECKKLVEYINHFGYTLNAVSNKEFASRVTHYLNTEHLKNSIAGIITDLKKDKTLDYTSNIEIHADISNSFLNNLNFHWPILDELYFKKYFEFFEKTNYFTKTKTNY